MLSNFRTSILHETVPQSAWLSSLPSVSGKKRWNKLLSNTSVWLKEPDLYNNITSKNFISKVRKY